MAEGVGRNRMERVGSGIGVVEEFVEDVYLGHGLEEKRAISVADGGK